MRSTLFILALLTLRCAPVHQRAQALPLAPLTALFVHADVEFTFSERALIDSAVTQLSRYRIAVLLAYDLDFTDTESLRIPDGDWRLIRVPTESRLPLVFDSYFGGQTLGACTRPTHDMYLLPWRADTERQLQAVAEHEMLHAIGLNHTALKKSNVMSPAAFSDSAVELSSDDMLELCSTIRCR